MKSTLDKHPFFIDHQILSFTKFTGGLNHQVYKVTTDLGVFVTRSVERKNNDLVLQNEVFNLGFSANVLFYSADSPLAVIEYIVGEHPTKSYWSSATLNQFAKTLATLHQHKSNLTIPSLNLADTLNQYDKKLDLSYELKIQISQAILVLKHWEKKGKTFGLCHNDLNPSNMICRQNRLWLIDWEYAAITDIYFDLAGFIVEHKLTPSDEKVFLTAYHSSQPIVVELQLSKKLAQMKGVYRLICHLWHIEKQNKN